MPNYIDIICYVIFLQGINFINNMCRLFLVLSYTLYFVTYSSQNNNLFENAQNLCPMQLVSTTNQNTNSVNSQSNINFDSLITCVDISKSAWYKFSTNQNGGDANLVINGINCTGDSNLIYQSSIQAVLFSYSVVDNNPIIQILGDCIEDNEIINFNLTNLYANHFYYLLVNGFSDIDSINVSSTCTFQIQVSGPAVKPIFSAGEDLYVTPNTTFQLNAFGFGNPEWYPNTLMDSIYSFTPNISLNTTTEFLLTITDTNSCVYKDVVKVYVENPLIFYNTITPNSDGINDNWIIENIQDYPFCRINIYNRWGQEIFQSIGYSENQRWDGTISGNPLPVGTYFYIVSLGSAINNQTFKGSITLLR